MSLQLTSDPQLKNYLTDVVSQLKGLWPVCSGCLFCSSAPANVSALRSVCVCVCVSEWLYECTVQKLVLVITCLETNQVLERWQFDIECDKAAKESR